jgi:putative Holliday junction resolvase
MRYLGVDPGRRRIGLALSDPAGILARPWQAVAAAATPAASADCVMRVLASAADPLGDAASVGAIIVGLPRRLDGRDNEQSAWARDLAAALATLTSLDVHLQDERRTSHEAEARLAERERDWRRRKARVDAAAAAIILQDFLDARARPLADGPPA